MSRTELKRLWKRSKMDRKFRRPLHTMLAALVWEPSNPEDQLNACALAGYILKNAGKTGRRDLKRRLIEAGWEL
jgi:hypothetical protein